MEHEIEEEKRVRRATSTGDIEKLLNREEKGDNIERNRF